MPIPSLPIEIVGEITSHLRTPEQGDTEEAIESGQSLSLVCRRWYPIGQALRWKDLQIDIASVPSLLTHFDLHPHLPQLVASLNQLNPNTSATAVEEEQQGHESLPKLLSALQKLRSLYLRPRESTFEAVLHAAANLPNLILISIYARGAPAWSKGIDTTLARGFASIREFSLLVEDLITVAGGPSNGAVSNHMNLQRLTLSWAGSILSSPIHLILANINLTALQSLALGGVPTWTFPFERLAECTSLGYLRVYDSPQFLPSTFPNLVANLSKARSLVALDYQVVGGGGDNPSYPSSITIDELFASVPRNLKILKVNHIVFANSDSVQDQPLESVQSGDRFCVVLGLIVTSEGVRCAEFRREWGTKEKKIYRCVLEYASWDEYDARNIESA